MAKTIPEIIQFVTDKKKWKEGGGRKIGGWAAERENPSCQLLTGCII